MPLHLASPLRLVRRLRLPTSARNSKVSPRAACLCACKPYPSPSLEVHAVPYSLSLSRFPRATTPLQLPTPSEDSPADVPHQGDVKMVSGEGTAAGANEAGEEEEVDYGKEGQDNPYTAESCRVCAYFYC